MLSEARFLFVERRFRLISTRAMPANTLSSLLLALTSAILKLLARVTFHSIER